MNKFIAIAGNMGVGKTTMVNFLCQRYGFQPVYEPYTHNPYLDDFYKDMKQWGFHSQLYFLTHKDKEEIKATKTSYYYPLKNVVLHQMT